MFALSFLYVSVFVVLLLTSVFSRCKVLRYDAFIEYEHVSLMSVFLPVLRTLQLNC